MVEVGDLGWRRFSPFKNAIDVCGFLYRGLGVQ